MSHATSIGQAQRFDMTGGDDLVEVVIVNLYGQQVAKLPLARGKTIGHTEGVESGIYFYKMEVNGEVLSGKVVVQK